MFRHSSILAAVTVLAAISSAHAQVKLERKFTEGANFVTRNQITLKQTLTINGMGIDTAANSTLVSRSKVGKRDASGILPVEVTLEGLQVNLNLPGGMNVLYDSANPNAKSIPPAMEFLGDMYRAMVGSTVTYQLDAKNAVSFVQGADAIVGKTSGTAADLLRAEFKTDNISKAFQQETSRFPDQPVKNGETWRRNTVLFIGSGQSLTFDIEYKYQGAVEEKGKKLDRIATTYKSVTYAIEPDAPIPLKVTSSDLKPDSSEGEILFDRDRGVAVREKSKMRITGSMKLSINNTDLPADLVLSIESDEAIQD